MSNNAKTGLGGAVWLGLFLGCLCYIFTMYLRSCPAILALDLQKSFGTDATGVTLFSSAALVGYGLMQMPAGVVTDVLGGRKTLAIFMFLAAGATLVFAFAPSLNLGVAARFVTGLTLAAMPPLGVVLAVSFPRERYTQAMGILMASGGLGNILAAEPLARLSLALGWRGAMMVSAVCVCALGLLVLLVFREKSAAPDSPPKAGAAAQFAGIGRAMKRIFRSAHFWHLNIWLILASVVFFSFMSMWAGPYLMQGYGLDKLTASRVLLAQGIATMAVVPLLGTLVEKLGSRRLGLVICSVLGLAGSSGLALFSGSLPLWLLTLCILGIPLSGLTGATCVFSLVRRNFPPDITGTGIGCVNMFWPFLAALLNLVLGFALDLLLGGAAPETLPRPELAAAYGKIMFIYVGCHAGALLWAVFFVKENFTLKT